MTAEPLPAESTLTAATWQHLDDLVDEIARLSEASLAPREFWRRLLDRTVRALAASGGSVWRRDPEGRLAVETQVQPADAPVFGPTQARRHAELLAHVCETGLALSLPPHSASGGESTSDNPTPYLLLLSPVMCDDAAVAVIEVWQRPTDAPSAPEGYLRFLSAVCELAADYDRQQQFGAMQARAGLWGRFDRFTQAVHRSLNRRRVAFTIANDARPLVNCDRAALALVRGRRVRIECISGVDTLDRRSQSVRSLTRLVKTAVKIDEPFWYPENAEQLPPQIEQALEAYLDQSHARQLAIIPLHRTEDTVEGQTVAKPVVIGALVIEHFKPSITEDNSRHTIEAVAAQSALALSNALELESVPLAGVWHALGRARWLVRRRQLPKTLLALAAVAAIVAALVYVPIDFNIEARGELWPASRRDVFAPVDGVISEIRVAHGDRVEAGQTLLVLRKPQLDFERTRVTGELQTARKKLASLQASRYGGAAASAEAREQAHQRTADEEEVKELIKSLTQQLEVLERQEAELTVKSPIAGQVLTWDVTQLLESRPVERGRMLLSIGDEQGPWKLDMRVADDRIGHVLAAQQAAAAPLDVEFLLAMDPDHSYVGHVDRVAMTTDTFDETDGPQVLVTADVDPENIPRLRPGASVVAKIQCGRRSAGFVWLHEIWDTVRTRILF